MQADDCAALPALVLTVGHSNRALQDFLTLLRVHQATLVVDVRKMPRSRHNPQFNIDTLPEALRRASTDYVHFPGLGGLRHRRPNSPNAGWQNTSFQAFADYMLTSEFDKNLRELLGLACRQRAVLCAEALPCAAIAP